MERGVARMRCVNIPVIVVAAGLDSSVGTAFRFRTGVGGVAGSEALTSFRVALAGAAGTTAVVAAVVFGARQPTHSRRALELWLLHLLHSHPPSASGDVAPLKAADEDNEDVEDKTGRESVDARVIRVARAGSAASFDGIATVVRSVFAVARVSSTAFLSCTGASVAATDGLVSESDWLSPTQSFVPSSWKFSFFCGSGSVGASTGIESVVLGTSDMVFRRFADDSSVRRVPVAAVVSTATGVSTASRSSDFFAPPSVAVVCTTPIITQPVSQPVSRPCRPVLWPTHTHTHAPLAVASAVSGSRRTLAAPSTPLVASS